MRYAYANGQVLSGMLARADVSLGDYKTTKRIPIDVVDGVRCSLFLDRCRKPIAQRLVDPGQALGDKNYHAIIGVSMPHHDLRTKVPNPLMSFGDAWIIDLPPPGKGTGRLIINPTASDMNGYIRFPAEKGPNVGGGRDNPVPGCLTNDENHESYCGPFVLDTGNPRILVITGRHFHVWRPGTKATIRFNPDHGQPLLADFRVGVDNMDATRVGVGPFPEAHQPPSASWSASRPIVCSRCSMTTSTTRSG